MNIFELDKMFRILVKSVLGHFQKKRVQFVKMSGEEQKEMVTRGKTLRRVVTRARGCYLR